MRVAHLFRPGTERENSYVTSTYSVTSIDLISSYRGNCGLETFYLFNKVLFIYVCVYVCACVHACVRRRPKDSVTPFGVGDMAFLRFRM